MNKSIFKSIKIISLITVLASFCTNDTQAMLRTKSSSNWANQYPIGSGCCAHLNTPYFQAIAQIIKDKKIPQSPADMLIGKTKFPTLSSWIDVCNQLTYNNNYGTTNHYSGLKTAFGSDQDQAWKEFKIILQTWFTMTKCLSLQNKHAWEINNQGNSKPSELFYDTKQTVPFTPFVQKKIFNKDDVINLHGDLHGDIHTLIEELKNLQHRGIINNNFKITQPNYYMVFLGDYTDIGHYGAEVIYSLLRLSLANPEQVILIRGNHEDMNINQQSALF